MSYLNFKIQVQLQKTSQRRCEYVILKKQITLEEQKGKFMTTIIEKQINESSSREIKLNGFIGIKVEKDKSFSVGKNIVKKLITISKSNIVVDGSNATIYVEICDNLGIDTALFYINNETKNICFKNMKIHIYIANSCNTVDKFFAIYNTASNVYFQNCIIDLQCINQMNLYGIYNYGIIDLDMLKNANNLSISDCNINVICSAKSFTKDCSVYGIYNHLANSISVQNTYVNTINDGIGENQKSIGIFTSGRFGRFTGNNIKANSSHTTGTEKEKGSSFGFINRGDYSIITSNNILGEWAGIAIGIENDAEYAKISSNKILATHTICGRCIRNYKNKNTFNDNILTSTSRNARLIETHGSDCIITNNYLEVLMPHENCTTGCGIYIEGSSRNHIVKNNIINNIKNCGIFAPSVSLITDNICVSASPRFSPNEKTTNLKFKKILDEKNIKSIHN